MKDNIRFSSDQYSSIAGQLDDVASALNSAKTALAAIDLSISEGAFIPVSLPTLKLSGGNRCSARTPARQLKVLSDVLESEATFVQSVRSAVATADSLFCDAENHILDVLAGRTNSSDISQDEALNETRMDAVQVLLKMLNMDNDNLNNLINRKNLEHLTAAGYVYNGLTGNMDSWIVNPCHNVAMGIIDSIGIKILPDKTLINAAADTADNIEKTVDAAVDINTIIFDEKSAEAFKAVLMALPFSEDELTILDKMNITCLGDITDLGFKAELIAVAKNIITDYTAMTTVDHDKLDSICSGMMASGSSDMIATAEYLQSMKDPLTCMKISIASNTKEFLLDEGSEIANEALLSLYPDPTGASQALIKLTQTGTDIMTNASGTADAATNLLITDNGRRTAYNAAINAINEYMVNPSEAAYQKVIDTKNSYYTLASESIDAFKGMAEAQNESAVGMFNKHNTSGFDKYADYLRSQTADTYVDHYASSAL